MEWMLKWDAPPNAVQIDHREKILLTGSCFTEHIGNSLSDMKFSILQNPNGILFDTLSVCRSLCSYVENRQLSINELFPLNEAWHSWEHHSAFSHPEAEASVRKINHSVQEAHEFLASAKWLVITLGSSFSYQLTASSPFAHGRAVANCHKAPAQWFTKYLIPIEEQLAVLEETIRLLRHYNPGLHIIFTVSPVRHIRDGVVENNRSKARLLETVHTLVQQLEGVYYFPAYELVIDVLRDYRFYDIDLVHPNYPATQFVLEHFIKSFVNAETKKIIEALRPIIIAMKHKAFHPESVAHKKFLLSHLEKTQQLQQQYPHLNLSRELAYFGNVVV